MNEETTPRKKAEEDVLIMAERLALLHYAFAATLEEELPRDEALRLTALAIKKYGNIAGKNAERRVKEAGLPATVENFKYGKDLPSTGWRSAKVEKPSDGVSTVSKITFCPLAETWENLGEDARRLGRLYCRVDQAKYESYGRGYACFHDENKLDGSDCCVIRVTEKKREKRDD